MQFGQRLAEIRKDNGHTQQRLADILHVSKHTISSWEQEKSVPSLCNLIQICELYSVSSDFLLGISDYDPPLERSREEHLFTVEERKKIREYEQFLIFQRKYNKHNNRRAGKE